ncbi:vacuolar protein-sorting-associated protein 36-like isoform X2 [Melanaphis sacchari]|uniref:vacuolar protein-sorting-associated protein 36-like isoform X2 n=1 Tax=Melanaphis sacchari TaxID=742174 RepID=UPI000DC1537E|nr:vacuolar protein-sorting-associated protein 36-like isoform X2 [Melanaphis sacchari]
MVGTRHLVFLAACVLYARSSAASPVYQEDDHFDGHLHEHHHGPPPATSYATISTTHVKVQHPPAAPTKYATPYKEYLTQPQVAYKYISLPSPVALQQSGKFEEPSTPGYKYLAASPTYKYVQPPAVTTEPEAAEEPTNSLKYALKYEQNSFKQEQEQQQFQQQEYEQPTIQYKYIAVPSYKYVQQVAAEPEYGQHHQQQQQVASSYDYTDDKQ